MTTKHEVISLHKQHPEWPSVQIARELDCCDSYVRATFKRNGLKLMRRTGTAEIFDLGRACMEAGITLNDLEILKGARNV